MENSNVPISKIIGQNIRRKRLELELSQSQLARKIGTNGKTTIADVESGRTNMNIITLIRYAKALECKLEDLLVGIEY